MFEEDVDPEQYVEEKGLKTVNDEGALRKVVEEVIAANPQLPRFIVNEVFSRPERYKLMSDKIVKVADCLMKGIQQELDELHAQGKVEWVDVRMLLLDIISLNVFPFIAYPIIEPILGDIAADRNRFFELRKAENIEMIMHRIKNNEL